MSDLPLNPRLGSLQPYPFTRLRALLQGLEPPADRPAISLAAGEPREVPFPPALACLQQHLQEFNRYPTIGGIPELSQAAASWLERRFQLPHSMLDTAQNILPVAGTREGIFSLVQTLAQPGRSVLFANPFYQMYEGSSLLAGMHTQTLATASMQSLRQVSSDDWRRCAILILCNPHNPTGEVLATQDLQQILAWSDQYGFVVVVDECYADIYLDEAQPPPSLLQACQQMGRNLERCIVLHSLSKRSSLAGFRSGFVAGDADILKAYASYRSYHGVSLPIPIQRASVLAWNDDAHTKVHRATYRAKFEAFDAAFEGQWRCPRPAGGFYYWMPVPERWHGDDEAFCIDLYTQAGVEVVPGRYLACPPDASANSHNPGAGFVRLALVDDLEACRQAGMRMHTLISH
ncbi:MAG: aminotransferase class I/II-fold pyridoxal phosphate-dependent enzyme [Gammaproteobacteria bacterium]